MTDQLQDRIRGGLFASAFGDALGRRVEFLGMDEILNISQYGRLNPELLEPHWNDPIHQGSWLITDDTQMALAVANALMHPGALTSDAIFAKRLALEFARWFESPENDRAPGRTCLESCEKLVNGTPWTKSGSRGSKGCGANMRVTPIALLGHRLERTHQSRLAQLQSLPTHAHPTALAASDLTCAIIDLLIQDAETSTLLARTRAELEQRRELLHDFDSFWQGPGETTYRAFMDRGWSEVEAILNKVESSLSSFDGAPDPCRYIGEGWTAEESLGCALFSLLVWPDDPVRAIQFAAASSGDSDSIACLTGAFAGAAHGLSSFPDDWLTNIEHESELRNVCEFAIRFQHGQLNQDN